MSITKIISELGTALEASTQGNWHVEDPMGDLELSIVIGDDPLEWQFIASAHHDDDMVSRQTEANAKFIVMAHCHLPSLIAEIKRQDTEIDLLKQSLAHANARITKLKLYGTEL